MIYPAGILLNIQNTLKILPLDKEGKNQVDKILNDKLSKENDEYAKQNKALNTKLDKYTFQAKTKPFLKQYYLLLNIKNLKWKGLW